MSRTAPSKKELALKKQLNSTKKEKKIFAKALSEANHRFSQRVKELSILRRVDDSISSSLDKKTVCTNIVGILISELTAENCSVMLLAQDGKTLLLKAARGQKDKKTRYYDDREAKKLKTISVGKGIAGRVAKTGKSILIKDIKESKRFINLEGGLKEITSLLCMPITGENGTIGVLNLSHPYIGKFSKENERFLKLILSQAALALENIRLFEETKKFNTKLESLVAERTAELRDSEQKYKGFMKYGSDAVIIASAKDGLIIECNDKLHELTGIKPAIWEGRHLKELFSKSRPKKILARVKDKKIDKKIYSENSFIKKRNRKTSTPVNVTCSSINLVRGSVLYLTIRDITEQVLLEKKRSNYSKKLEHDISERTKELKQTQSELIQAAKMSSLGELASGVAHEINNPIAIIKGYAEHLQYSIKDGEPIKKETLRKTLRLITESAERCSNITDGILNFSRPRQNRISTCRIKEVSLICLQMVRPHMGNLNHKISVTGNGQDSVIETDQSHLEQVIINLLNNSIDACKEGGKIVLNIEKKKDLLKLNIIDNGEGIPTEYINKIYDPFFTTKEPGKGTGLGLAISYRIVQLLGGQISVSSKPGRTVFTVSLPIKNRKKEDI